MASEINTRRWDAAAIGEILAARVVMQQPSLDGVHWRFRVNGNLWMELEFDPSLPMNVIEDAVASQLSSKIVLTALEQSAALEKQAVDKAYGLGQQLIDKLKEELTVA